jgi:TonB family protein
MSSTTSMSTPSPASSKPAPETPPRVQGAGLGELHFDFGANESHFGNSFWVSVALHALAVAVIFLIGSLLPKEVYQAVLPENLPSLVFLPVEGPGGGGGGGGNKSPEPPKQTPKVEVPAVKPATPKLDPPKEVEPPKEEITAPIETTPAPDPTPAIVASAEPSPSQGTGTAGGAGTGTGTGIGSGQGSGIGPGFGGGIGGGAYMPGNGVTNPTVIREVKPAYTAEAMRAKVQGTVWLQCVVLPDGTVGNVQITKSLDSTFGLDQEAIKAAKNWRFKPGMRMGEPVPVLVTIELTFTLR